MVGRREVKFFVRIFPTTERDLINFKIESNRKTMHVRSPQDLNKYEPKYIYWEFNTNGIFCNSCQIDVYKEAIEDLVHRALNGEDAVVLAYGPSSTGKTYTITGLRGKYEHRGIAPRMLSELFSIRQELQEVTKMKIYLSFVEFFGKQVRNLLKNPPTFVSLKRKEAPMVRCDTESEALRLIFDGESRRRFEKGFVSCSTTVITFHLDTMWISKADSHFMSKIHIVDTAGTQSIKRKARSDNCQVMSNMTMSWLGYLLTNSTRAQHYDERSVFVRVSQLTEFIGPALLNGNIRLIAHIKLTTDALLANLSTMKFGAAIKRLPLPELVYARKQDRVLRIQALKEENRHLKDALLLNELLKGQYSKANMSQEELNHLMRLAEAYLHGRISEPAVLVATENSIILPLLKNIYKRDVTELTRESEKNEERLQVAKRVAPADSERIKPLKLSKKGMSVSLRSSSALKMSRSSRAVGTSSSRPSLSVAAKASHSSSSSLRSQSRTITQEISYTFMDSDDIIKDALWCEFYNRYPELEKKLMTLRINVVNALRDKENASMNAMKFRCRLDEAKVKLEDAQWRRKATVGDVVGPDGQEIQSEAEKQALLDVESITKEYLAVREHAASAHAKYVDLVSVYNDMNETARLEFQDYINKTYTTTLVLPYIEDEQIKVTTVDDESVVDLGKEVEQGRLYFEHLQKSHGKNLMPNNVCKSYI